MPIVRPSADLHNKYFELYSLIDEGLNQIKQEKIKPMKETIKLIREQIKK
ncbi:MAG: hypothetical protein FWH53_04630 [Leptospirales bacterium]|nr:hypothetical protein [Leptospirales bacterium]